MMGITSKRQRRFALVAVLLIAIPALLFGTGILSVLSFGGIPGLKLKCRNQVAYIWFDPGRGTFYFQAVEYPPGRPAKNVFSFNLGRRNDLRIGRD